MIICRPKEKDVWHYLWPLLFGPKLLYWYLQMWKHPCAQVIFDSDPAPKGRSQPAQVEEMSQAMIR